MIVVIHRNMFNKSKGVLIILAVTGLGRVFIFAIPVVGIYFGVNSSNTEQVE